MGPAVGHSKRHLWYAVCPRCPTSHCHRLFFCRSAALAIGRGHHNLFRTAIVVDSPISTISGRSNSATPDYGHRHGINRGHGHFATKPNYIRLVSLFTTGHRPNYGMLCRTDTPVGRSSSSISNANDSWLFCHRHIGFYPNDWANI